MRYKVGDEVVIRGKVTDIVENVPYSIRVKTSDCNEMFYAEYEVESADKTYADGLKDAWELAKRLFAFELDEREKMLGYQSMKAILEDLTPEYVMDRIEAYENEKEIKVGDEVVHGVGNTETKFVVTYLGVGNICGYEKNGNTHQFCFPNRYIKKTGKHIDIESLLKQIGE